MTTIKLCKLDIDPADDTITVPTEIRVADDFKATACYLLYSDGAGDVEYASLSELLIAHMVDEDDLLREWPASPEEQAWLQAALRRAS